MASGFLIRWVSTLRRLRDELRQFFVVASLIPTAAFGAPPPGASANSVKVGDEQMHQLRLVPAELCEFQMKKMAIGQIAFNEDASTVVLTPFAGRVTRLIAKIGDEVKIGDPLFEIDSPEVVQAQTDLIAADRHSTRRSLNSISQSAYWTGRLVCFPIAPPRSARSTRPVPISSLPRMTSAPRRVRSMPPATSFA